MHGGPGSGRSRTAHKAFDHNVFQIVAFDQRGCGGSLPSAAEPDTDMSVNTTEHLLADMEALRQHLGVQRWLLHGGSWASTLILAYTQRHPERVEGVILIGVTMTRPREVNWLYRGLRMLLPEQWERFRDGRPEPLREGNLVEGYRQLINDPDPEVRGNAAREWCAWQDAAIAHETQGTPGQYSAKVDEQRLAFVRICTHYFAHHAWLPDDELLRGAHLLANIPGILIHGRLDLSAPLLTALELSRAWRGAELVGIEDSGHTGIPAYRQPGDAGRTAKSNL